jgi:hypothetical protein
VEALETLPARVAAVESQIVLLRDEMRREFAATREQIRAGDDSVRTELRADIRAEISSLRAELLTVIRAGDEETRRYMRVLHEEVMARLATLQEGRRRRKPH